MTKQTTSLQRKHVPQRMCIVCRESNAKRTLTRLVRTASDGVVVDRSGKLNGRGAYLCDKRSCWQRVVETDSLEKALRTTLTPIDKQRLSEVLSTMPESHGEPGKS